MKSDQLSENFTIYFGNGRNISPKKISAETSSFIKHNLHCNYVQKSITNINSIITFCIGTVDIEYLCMIEQIIHNIPKI